MKNRLGCRGRTTAYSAASAVGTLLPNVRSIRADSITDDTIISLPLRIAQYLLRLLHTIMKRLVPLFIQCRDPLGRLLAQGSVLRFL